MEKYELKQIMEENIKEIIRIATKFYFNSTKGIGFITNIAIAIKKSIKKREAMLKNGIHVPPFIIASITSSCNLTCAGCYSRASGDCNDDISMDLTAMEWEAIFNQSYDMGVNFVLLAGGEPLMREDVIQIAAKNKNMIFPIFTNGTLIDEKYMALFEKHRNLIPVLSIEGDLTQTNKRRGEGAYEKIQETASYFKKKKVLFGASITVSKENISEVITKEFMEGLRFLGCGLVFFVEYVPINKVSEHLMLDTKDVAFLQKEVDNMRKSFDDIIVVAFPGDEEMLGGCLASGRGFFHINAKGGAEPCPFSPYSVLNLKSNTLEEVLRSDFFIEMQKISSSKEHMGGCTLFNNDDKVKELVLRTKKS